jgi:chromosome segregation ATPase
MDQLNRLQLRQLAEESEAGRAELTGTLQKVRSQLESQDGAAASLKAELEEAEKNSQELAKRLAGLEAELAEAVANREESGEATNKARSKLAVKEQGSILLNSISAENFLDKLLAQNFGQSSIKKTPAAKLSDYFLQ